MSAISNTHDVVLFDSKKSKAFDGQRLSKVVYKTPKKGGPKLPSKCVSIPLITEVSDTFIDGGLQYIANMMMDAQNGIVKDLVEAGKTVITDDDINEDAILRYLAEEAAGNRLTKETINEWFTVSLADLLTVAFADKLGVGDTPTEEQTAMIGASVDVYKEKFASLAGGKTSYSVDVATKLLKALELVDIGEDELAGKFKVRLEGMKDEKKPDMLGL